MPHIHLDSVSCIAQSGAPLFPPFSAIIEHEVVGLFGRNGCGKSTLLSTVAGLRPVAIGQIIVDGTIGFMHQAPFAWGVSVAQALGVAEQLASLARIEAGEADETDFDNADWTLPSRIERILAQAGLAGFDPDRSAAQLSGGEQRRVKLAALALAEPDILLLDEPSNDLDQAGRAFLADLLKNWDGPALVASHDRALLDQMDRMIELSPAGALIVGGGWKEFEQQRNAQRARAATALEQAEAKVKQAEANQQARKERQDQRNRQGRSGAKRRDDTKLEVNARKAQADKTSARGTAAGEDRIAQAMEAVQTARAEVERVVPIKIDLPSSGLMASHVLIEAEGLECAYAESSIFGALDLTITGPERIALIGPNGSGKTSLLKILSGQTAPSGGTLQRDGSRIAVLDQHLSLLHSGETALQTMRRHNPALSANDAHAGLARFGFRGDWGARETESLSGGERVRLALACLFSSPTPPQLLILDEPTNHLDIYAIELLEQALRDYDGALICVSHDTAFRNALALGRTVDLTRSSAS